MPTAAVAYLVSQSEAFGWLRLWASKHSAFFDKLFACGYCLSHWIAVPLVIIYDMRIFKMFWPLDYLLTILVIAWLATFQYVILDRIWE